MDLARLEVFWPSLEPRPDSPQAPTTRDEWKVARAAWAWLQIRDGIGSLFPSG